MATIFCFLLAYLSEALTAWLYFSYLFPSKEKLLFKASSYIIAFSLLFIFHFPNIIILNTISFIIAHYILARLNYNVGKWTALFHAGLLTVLMNAGEIISILVQCIFTNDLLAYTYNFITLLLMTILSKLLYLLGCLICAKLFFRLSYKYIESNMLILFCLLPIVSSFLIVIFDLFTFMFDIPSFLQVALAVGSLVILLLNIAMIFVFNYTQSLTQEKIDRELTLQKEKADASYYHMLYSQYEQQRVIIHDIKDHLYTLNALAGNGDITSVQNYISKLVDLPVFKKRVYYSDNKILNALLLQFIELSQKNKLHFYIDVRNGSIDFMNEIDISTLFGNILTNAMESASCSEDRRIELSIQRKHGQNTILISCVNSCDQRPSIDKNGHLVTSKRDSKNHGLGQRSIARIVKEYHGQYVMSYDVNEHEFHTIITFPG